MTEGIIKLIMNMMSTIVVETDESESPSDDPGQSDRAGLYSTRLYPHHPGC
mgnify:CR=1 FL=1